jgi:hypothetical protein
VCAFDDSILPLSLPKTRSILLKNLVEINLRTDVTAASSLSTTPIHLNDSNASSDMQYSSINTNSLSAFNNHLQQPHANTSTLPVINPNRPTHNNLFQKKISNRLNIFNASMLKKYIPSKSKHNSLSKYSFLTIYISRFILPVDFFELLYHF